MICTTCNTSPARAGLRSCAECAAYKRSTNGSQRAAVRAAGGCAACGHEPATEGRFCAPCHARYLVARRATRAALKAAGRCANCRGPNLTTTTRCEACRVDHRAKMKIYNGSRP